MTSLVSLFVDDDSAGHAESDTTIRGIQIVEIRLYKVKERTQREKECCGKEEWTTDIDIHRKANWDTK